MRMYLVFSRAMLVHIQVIDQASLVRTMICTSIAREKTRYILIVSSLLQLF